MSNKEKTILTLESNGCKFTAEMNWDAGMNDLLESFNGLCVAATFSPKTILKCMQEFATEKLEAYFPEEFSNTIDFENERYN